MVEFDKNDLTYKVVRYPGETVLYNDLKATTFTDKTITELKGYYYKVTAVAASGEGVSANSNAVVSGPAIEKNPIRWRLFFYRRIKPMDCYKW